jgi:cytochrome c-type biogenesis protein CcmE
MTELRSHPPLPGLDEAEPADAAAPSSPAHGSAADPSWLAPATRPSAAGRRPTRGPRRASWRLLSVGAVLVAAVGFLLYKGIGTSLDYYVTVRQALAEQSTLAGKTFRLQGIVLPGTITHHGTIVDFTVAQVGDRRLQVPVVQHGSPPQLFRSGVPVIVQGHFDGGRFVSDQVIVDHTGNYSPERDGPRSS